ncbi:MAG: UDP-N-acetylmuramate dehydrogenase [Kiritimatiellae bacterium]|nr:UDP-N-acetylmuramate dehydrogenase [Kiritimatiellia bacterium]
MTAPRPQYDFAGDSNIKAAWDAPLADYTTFRLGGACTCVMTCGREETVELIAREFRKMNGRFMMLGEGSNVLVSDHGYNGVVVRYLAGRPGIQRAEGFITVSGATRLDDLARHAAEHGLDGLTAATGIPGTVGGAVAGNVGAHGWSVGQTLDSALVLGRDGAEAVVSAADLEFGYRQSRIRRTGEIVLSATFRVSDADKAELVRERERMLEERQARLPDWRRLPCAGSFFRNPGPAETGGKGQTAGQLLEQVGAKGLARGGARVWEKHANVIVRASENCRAQDVYDLALEMARRVREQFGVRLVPEVRLVGPFEGEALAPPA